MTLFVSNFSTYETPAIVHMFSFSTRRDGAELVLIKRFMTRPWACFPPQGIEGKRGEIPIASSCNYAIDRLSSSCSLLVFSRRKMKRRSFAEKVWIWEKTHELRNFVRVYKILFIWTLFHQTNTLRDCKLISPANKKQSWREFLKYFRPWNPFTISFG